MNTQFIDPYDEWSVSTAFCRFGTYRCNQLESQFVEALRRDRTSPHLCCADRDAQRKRQVWRTEAVADCIRALGYTVECGNYRCITQKDADVVMDKRCGGAYRGSNFIIMNIIAPDGEYVYGSSSSSGSVREPLEQEQKAWTRFETITPSVTRDDEDRDLCGHRTIYEYTVIWLRCGDRKRQPYDTYQLQRNGRDVWRLLEPRVDDNGDLAFDQTINNRELIHHSGGDWSRRRNGPSHPRCLRLCDNGARSQKWEIDKERISAKWDGVSTIGNTLPSDIVEALQDFTHSDNKFFKEAAYEFYIPDSMIPQLPDACPCEESVELPLGSSAGASAVAVATGETVTPVGDSDSDSDSDSDEE